MDIYTYSSKSQSFFVTGINQNYTTGRRPQKPFTIFLGPPQLSPVRTPMCPYTCGDCVSVDE